MASDGKRFEADVLPHIDAAYNLARWLSRSATDADDVVQDALLLAFRNFDAQRGPNTRAWFLAIVRNAFLSAVRRAAPRAAKTETIDTLDATAPPAAMVRVETPESEAVAAERAGSVDAVLERLPEDFREMLVLREMEGLSYREIATATGAPIGTVMSRLARARAAFRTDWQRMNGGADDVLP